MATTRTTQAGPARWSLEVVRGRDPGRVFAVEANEAVLGNAPGGAGGIDLRDQEGASPRRMAARQAALAIEAGELVIRDLDSPGGTFVNRRRLLSGQSLRLRAGDEIQVGGVVLRVAIAEGGGVPQPSPPPPVGGQPPPAAGGRLPLPYPIGDVACRTWDDFLVVAAQRWADLREELTSGRLADYLGRIHRSDLIPPSEAGPSPDDRLDRWLGRLPASRPTSPELDVHPEALHVRPSGGTTRQVLRVSNIGYRLLRGTARVEPSASGWVRILPPHDGRPFEAIEHTDLTVEVTVPEGPGGASEAAIVIESNGGTRRIPVRVRTAEAPPFEAVSPCPVPEDWFRPVSEAVAGVRTGTRFAIGIGLALAARGVVSAASAIPTGGVTAEARLPGLAAVCAALGLVAGLWLAGRREDGGPLDAAGGGVAAALVGVMAAAVLYALARTVEGPLGGWEGSPWAVGVLWAGLGAAVSGLTCWLLPFREPPKEPAR